MKNSIIAFIMTLVIFYLAGSFTFASFDIEKWAAFGRGFIAFSAIVFGAMFFGMFYEDNN